MMNVHIYIKKKKKLKPTIVHKTKNDSFIVNATACCKRSHSRKTNKVSRNRVFNYIRTSRKSVNFETMSQSDMKEKKKKKMKRKKFLARENPLCNGSESRLTEDEEKRHVYEHVHIRDKRSNSTGGEFTRQRESRGLVCPWKFSSTCLTLFTRHWTELSLTVGMVHDSQQEQRTNDREDLKLNLPPRMEGSLTKYEMDMEGRNRD